MRSEWGQAQAISEMIARHGGSIKTGPFGTTLKASEYVRVGVPLISVREIGHGSFHIDEKTPRIAAATLSRLPEYILQEGDIVFARKGGIERCALVRQQQDGWFLGSDGIRLRPPKTCDARFLAYCLQTKAVKDWLIQHSTGSTMASLNQAIIGRVPIVLPSLMTQRAIADTLEVFDRRIDLLRQTNSTLESIAQALFRSWFIDFDPVRAKAEGREPEGMGAATAALFPSEFERSVFQPIPRGWSAGAFGDLAELAKGTVNPLSAPNTTFEHYSLPAFDVDQLPIFEFGESIKSNKTKVPFEVVLQSKLNPHIPRVWLPARVGDAAVCSTEFLPWVPKRPASAEVVYCTLTSVSFGGAVRALVTGTSNSHQRVKPDQVAQLPVIVAPGAVYAAFTSVARPLLSRASENRWTSRNLAEVRDALLPRLISGKLGLHEAERELNEVIA